MKYSFITFGMGIYEVLKKVCFNYFSTYALQPAPCNLPLLATCTLHPPLFFPHPHGFFIQFKYLCGRFWDKLHKTAGCAQLTNCQPTN